MLINFDYIDYIDNREYQNVEFDFDKIFLTKPLYKI